MAKRPKAEKKPAKEGEKRPRGRPRKNPEAEPRKLTPDEASVIPVEMLAAARNGDKTAIEALDEILTAYNRLRLAIAKQAEVTEECRQRTKSEWAALTGAIESPVKIDATVEQLRRKLEDVEVRWQEYTEAMQANKLETKDARKACKAAQKDLDEAVKGSAQLKLPFAKREQEYSTVAPEALEQEGDPIQEQDDDFDDEDDEDEEDETGDLDFD